MKNIEILNELLKNFGIEHDFKNSDELLNYYKMISLKKSYNNETQPESITNICKDKKLIAYFIDNSNKRVLDNNIKFYIKWLREIREIVFPNCTYKKINAKFINIDDISRKDNILVLVPEIKKAIRNIENKEEVFKMGKDKRKIQIILEVDDTYNDLYKTVASYKDQIKDCELLSNDNCSTNIIGFSHKDKNDFLLQSTRGDKFKDFLELQLSVLKTGIDIYNKNLSIPTSNNNLDFLLNKVNINDLENING